MRAGSGPELPRRWSSAVRSGRNEVTSPRVARRARKGKGRSRIAVLRDAHHRSGGRRHTRGMSEDDGGLLIFPKAADAIELRHLRAFVAVAEELNFGRAAAALYVSQPALSRQIRALEQLMGCELLRRSTHRVELTLAGEALLDRARRRSEERRVGEGGLC